MSPVGGVGINLAIQDAVAASNILTASLLKESVSEANLQRVQQRRERPTRQTQALQVFLQERILSRVLNSSETVSLPWVFRLFNWLPILRAIPARIIGIGFRPEHVQTQAAPSVKPQRAN